jgi:predicted HTH domain antitoxin
MRSLSIPYPEELMAITGQSPEALEEELRLLLAFKLFEIHRLSLGKAARFADMNKARFMEEAGRYKVPLIDLDTDQIEDELRDD